MTKINILDGAIGSELIKKGETLPPNIWSAKINISNPKLLFNIHTQYIKAGSDYITTNTFRTTARAYKKTGLSHFKAQEEANKSMEAAIRIAKKAAIQSTKILGSIAPLEDCYLPHLFPGNNIAKNEFLVIAKSLREGGIDGYILETMNNISETKICLEVIQDFNLPVWVSFNLLDGHHIRSGEKLIDAINMTVNFNVDYILLNCNPLERTNDAMKIISDTSYKWGIYPNLGVGEPSPDGIINNYYSDKEFLELCKNAINLGASVLGGCCGTSPRHIKLIRDYFG